MLEVVRGCFPSHRWGGGGRLKTFENARARTFRLEHSPMARPSKAQALATLRKWAPPAAPAPGARGRPLRRSPCRSPPTPTPAAGRQPTSAGPRAAGPRGQREGWRGGGQGGQRSSGGWPAVRRDWPHRTGGPRPPKKTGAPRGARPAHKAQKRRLRSTKPTGLTFSRATPLRRLQSGGNLRISTRTRAQNSGLLRPQR